VIIFFGPAGAGKSVQGQILAARYGWRWLSTGQLLRETLDPKILKKMSTGELVDNETTNAIMLDALKRSKDLKHVVLDGFPREFSQAKWLLSTIPEHGRSIAMVIVLEVPKSELLQRLKIRGRSDDIPKVIEGRLQIYRTQIYPILAYFNDRHIQIVHIDGTGTVGSVHDRIVSELELCSLV
jgi:adenylate kinase